MVVPTISPGRTWASLKSDLPLFALLQLPLIVLSIFFSRALAAFHAYPHFQRSVLWGLLLRSLLQDYLALGVIALAILVSRRFRAPEVVRGAGLIVLYAAFWALGALYFIGAAVFLLFGGPLSRDLVRMGAPLVGHSAKVLSFDDPLLQLMAVTALVPALLTPALWSTGRRLVRDDRRWAGSAWVCVLCLGAAGFAFGLLPTNPGRERRLVQVSPVALLLPSGWSAAARPPRPRDEHRRVIDRLLGGKRADGVGAFAPVARRKRNVVFWVLESVGERFLRSHHPLGTARTPQLDRLEARGSVRFSNAFVECPLSAQSSFTLVTGMSPPAHPGFDPSRFPIGQKTPYLPALLKAAGYHTAFLNSSYLSIWGERRFLPATGFDVVEDADNLPNRSRYRYQQWSIEGRALVDRFFEWRDRLPRSDPFFAIIWNVETHYRYQWIGMPTAYAADDDLTRYNRAIEYTDRLLGTFFDGLVERKLDQDTLIVAVGDHGQGLGRGERAYDRFESLLVGEDDIQVPLSFLDPGLPAGTQIIDTPVTLVDLYPTVLDLIGLPVPSGIDGASLAREYQPRLIFSRAITWWPLSVRAGRFKLIQDFAEDPPTLYDTASDPWEHRDLSGSHDDVVQALWSQLALETARRAREDPSFALFSSKDRVQH